MIMSSGTTLRIGEIFRYPRDGADPVVDGFRNFKHLTTASGQPLALLEAGINRMAEVIGPGGIARRPAILIRSSPWRAGSEATPWHDQFDLDTGHVRYFGDHKVKSAEPVGQTRGNSALLEELRRHLAATAEERAGAAPLLVFRGVPWNGRAKGQVEFCGVGLIERAERVVQRSAHGGHPSTFVNYVYDLALLKLTDEDDRLSWDWISARREPSVSDADCLKLAPVAWRNWVSDGHAALPQLRRRVARERVVKVRDQRPDPAGAVAKDLERIYSHFDGEKHAFESLAAAVAAHVLDPGGGSYRHGWLTRRSGDGGADFVGRLDVGSGLAGTSLVVLGQAKCVKPDSLISADQIARVVARLRRGWVGVYVTTGSYSEQAQSEMVEDQYPIVLVNGARLAQTVRSIAAADHAGDLDECLKHLVQRYAEISHRTPAEILTM